MEVRWLGTGDVMRSRLCISDFDPQGIFGLLLPKPVRTRVLQNDSRRFKNWRPLPFYQKGTLQMLFALFDDDVGGSVVISNVALTETNTGGLCHNGPAFHQDGILYEVGPALATRTAVASGEWWSAEPETDIGASYDVRTNGGAGGWGTAAAADTTWIQMSTERIWRVTVIAKSAPDIANASSLFEIRATGSGGALDSATIDAEAVN